MVHSDVVSTLNHNVSTTFKYNHVSTLLCLLLNCYTFWQLSEFCTHQQKDRVIKGVSLRLDSCISYTVIPCLMWTRHEFLNYKGGIISCGSYDSVIFQIFYVLSMYSIVGCQKYRLSIKQLLATSHSASCVKLICKLQNIKHSSKKHATEVYSVRG